jgi:hypothetical protein
MIRSRAGVGWQITAHACAPRHEEMRKRFTTEAIEVSTFNSVLNETRFIAVPFKDEQVGADDAFAYQVNP